MNVLIVGIIFILSSLFSIQKVLEIAGRRKSNTPQPQKATPSHEEIQSEAEISLSEDAYLILDKTLELHNLLQVIQRLSINYDSIQVRIDLIILNGEHYTLVWCEEQFAKNLSDYLNLTQPPKQSFSELEQILYASKANLDSFIHYINRRRPGIHRLFMIVENGITVTLISQSFIDIPAQNPENNQIETLMFSQLINKVKYKPALSHDFLIQRQRSLKERDMQSQS